MTLKKSTAFGKRRRLANPISAALLGAVCALCISGIALADNQQYNIPAGSLATALNKLAETGGLQLVYDTAIAEGLQSKGLSGKYSPEAALQQLLGNSGLSYRMVGSRTVTLEKMPTVPPDKVATLDKVTVTGKSSSYRALSQTTIAGSQLLQRQAQVQDTARLLEDIPGVTVQANGGVSSLPIIRGLSDERVKVEIDGMTITSACANHMNPPLSYIDRTNVGKIEVLQGVTPVSMGGDSIGGTIVVQSPDPVFAEAGKGLLLDGKLSGFYRSNGDAFGGSIAAGVANEHVRLDYTGAHSQSMNYRDGNDDIIKSTAYENQNHAAKLAFKFDNHLLEIKGGQQHIPFQGFPTARMDMLKNDSIFGNVHYKGDYDWGKLDGKLYLENTTHFMDIGHDKLFPLYHTADRPYTASHAIMPMDVRGRNLGYKVQAEIPFGQRDTFRVGNELHLNSLDEWWSPVSPYAGAPRTAIGGMWPNSFVNLNNASRDRLGTFAEWEANWSPEWKSMLGIRYDHTMSDTGNVQPYQDPVLSPTGRTVKEAAAFNAKDHERDFDTFDVSASMQFTPDKSSQYEFGYARKNRAPGIYELYPWSTNFMAMSMIGAFGDGNGYVGNINLEPETAHNISFTAAFHDADNDNWEIKATPYFSYVENFIDADRCGPDNPICNSALGFGYYGQPGDAATPGQHRDNGFYFLSHGNHDARLWGADLSARTHLFKDQTLGEFATHTVLGYVRGERMDGGNLYHMMPFNAKLSLDHKKGGWSSAVEMQFVDRKSDVQQIRNELTTPSYLLLNAKTGYTYKNLSIDVGLDNVLDKQYYHPLAGVNAGDYYAMSITNADWPYRNNRNLPGMGRSVSVGFTLTY
ncbi:MAG: TonB-dependent receptor [Methylobacter tundripaludum]|nr:TonB-dependent receptor [Methylobacter tundripaludum]